MPPVFGLNNLQALVGLVVIPTLCWLVSENRRRFPWRLLVGTAVLQIMLILLFFGTPLSGAILRGIAGAVNGLAGAAQAGTQFVFGFLAGGRTPYVITDPGAAYIYGFHVLPVMIVVCALSALFWYWGIMQRVARAFGAVFERVLGLNGPTALATAATIFLGQVEGPILVRAYLDQLTRAEMFILMAVGYACCSGAVMVGYATLLQGFIPNVAAHIVTAAILAAPVGVLMAQIIIPLPPVAERIKPDLTTHLKYRSGIDAVMNGTSIGLQLALNIAATQIVFIAGLILVNGLLGFLPHVGGEPLTAQGILGFVFRPLAWLVGIPSNEVSVTARFFGQKLALNTFIAFGDMVKLPSEALSERTKMLVVYALTGFANMMSVGVMSAGLSIIMPERRAEILQLAWKGLYAGYLATCFTAALVGVLPWTLFGQH